MIPLLLLALLTPPRAIDVKVVSDGVAGVAGASVEVLPKSSCATKSVANAITDPDGHAHFRDLQPGEYVVRVQLSGYAATTIGPIHVQASENANPRIAELVVLLNPVTWY